MSKEILHTARPVIINGFYLRRAVDEVKMDTIAEGSSVTCGICGKETTVNFITDRQGTLAYDLKCFHRNAICPTCGKLAGDGSETVHEVHPKCRTCNPEEFEDDDE